MNGLNPQHMQGREGRYTECWCQASSLLAMISG